MGAPDDRTTMTIFEQQYSEKEICVRVQWLRQMNVLERSLPLAPPKNSIYTELIETESAKYALFGNVKKFIHSYKSSNNLNNK